MIFTNQNATVNGKEVILPGRTIALMVCREETDSNGVSHLSPPEAVGARPGQTFGLDDSATGIGFKITPKLKQ